MATIDFVAKPFLQLNHLMTANAADILQCKNAMKLHKMMSTAVQDIDPRAIPVINGLKSIDSLMSRTVVKFRGMIQDMFDPEFYLSFYKTKGNSNGFNVGLYRDSLNDFDPSIDLDSDGGSVTLSKTSYLCISVPGENQWIRDKLKPEIIGSLKNDDSRTQKEVHPIEHEPIDDQGCKKMKTEEVDANKGPEKPMEKIQECHYFPINDCNKNRKAFLLQVYDAEVDLKLNDIVEVIGIIDFGSVPEVEDIIKIEEGGDGAFQVNEVRSLIQGMELEDTSFRVGSSLVPRIHVLVINKIKDMNPLTCVPSANIDSEQLSMGFFPKIRSELHAILTQALFGDLLAADYLICNLISRIYMRKDILSLGSFPLSIYNLPRMEKKKMQFLIESMYQLVSSLVTHSVYFPLSLESLNKGNFIPRKDYTLNKLLPGNLQLPNNMWMFVDETAMDAGLLTAQGINNLKALRELIKWQKLNYDFNFHSLEMETDVTVFVLSEGKSMLPVNFGVPLSVTSSLEPDQTFSAINEYLNQELLDNIRRYLTSIKQMDFSMSEPVQNQIQEDFVEMRQTSKVSPDDLHSLLTLARLMSLSFGESQLSLQMWERTLRMESERKQRASSIPSST